LQALRVVGGEGGLAKDVVASLTLRALSAMTNQSDHYMIANRDIVHACTYRSHNPSSFVTVNRREVAAPCSLGVVNVAMAHSASHNVNAHIVDSHFTKRQVFDD